MITPDEQTRRREDVRQACHSIAMEGGVVTDETQADLARYAEGEISGDEVLAQIRIRYGLPAGD